MCSRYVNGDPRSSVCRLPDAAQSINWSKAASSRSSERLKHGERQPEGVDETSEPVGAREAVGHDPVVAPDGIRVLGIDTGHDLSRARPRLGDAVPRREPRDRLGPEAGLEMTMEFDGRYRHGMRPARPRRRSGISVRQRRSPASAHAAASRSTGASSAARR